VTKDQKFNQVETLNGGGVYAANDGADYIIVSDYADEILLNAQEARELRDWLSKVLS
jgi:hypothetical protein